MATLTATDMTGSGDRTVTTLVLGVSDTFAYNAAKRPVLIINNITAGAITPNIDGDGATTVQCAGVGSVDVSGGFTTGSIAAGDSAAIPLKSIEAYLAGTIAMTGGDGAEAQLLEF